MKPCIIGGGSIGSIIALYLYKSGVKEIPIYYASYESVEEIKRQGGIFIVDKRSGEEFLVPVLPRHYTMPIDQCEVVFNTVKSYQVSSTVDLMRRLTTRDGLVLMLQNGFGSLEQAEANLPYLKIAGGVAYIGAERASRGRVIHHGGSIIIAGCRKKICHELLLLRSMFRIGGLELRVVEDIDYYRWLKLALNIVVNPVTALLRARNKIILEEEGLELARLILSELVEAARLDNYNFELDRLMSYIVRNVELVSENISSMAQDLMRGGKTEIDDLNGYIVKRLGDRALVNKIILLLVRLAEKSHSTL